jgi:hypothetical protein
MNLRKLGRDPILNASRVAAFAVSDRLKEAEDYSIATLLLSISDNEVIAINRDVESSGAMILTKTMLVIQQRGAGFAITNEDLKTLVKRLECVLAIGEIENAGLGTATYPESIFEEAAHPELTLREDLASLECKLTPKAFGIVSMFLRCVGALTHAMESAARASGANLN